MHLAPFDAYDNPAHLPVSKGNQPCPLRLPPPRILVTGATGQVGDALLRTLAPLGLVIAPGRDELDLADPHSIHTFIRDIGPRWIVNAAAYTAVDKAESESELAFAINAKGARALAEAADRYSLAIIHFSTDYVFNGQGTRPYIETDPTGPLGVYGASKLAGEQALVDSGVPAFIFRTSWVFGATGRNFLRTILKLARERDQLRIVGDQHGAPTWSRDLARLAAHVIGRCEAGSPGTRGSHDARGQAEARGEMVARLAGLYHATGEGETTWAGFAQEAIRQFSQRHPSIPLADVTAIPTAEYPTPARRPTNSRLDCTKLQKSLGYTMMGWKQSIAQVLTELDEVP